MAVILLTLFSVVFDYNGVEASFFGQGFGWRSVIVGPDGVGVSGLAVYGDHDWFDAPFGNERLEPGERVRLYLFWREDLFPGELVGSCQIRGYYGSGVNWNDLIDLESISPSQVDYQDLPLGLYGRLEPQVIVPIWTGIPRRTEADRPHPRVGVQFWSVTSVDEVRSNSPWQGPGWGGTVDGNENRHAKIGGVHMQPRGMLVGYIDRRVIKLGELSYSINQRSRKIYRLLDPNEYGGGQGYLDWDWEDPNIAYSITNDGQGSLPIYLELPIPNGTSWVQEVTPHRLPSILDSALGTVHGDELESMRLILRGALQLLVVISMARTIVRSLSGEAKAEHVKDEDVDNDEEGGLF